MRNSEISSGGIDRYLPADVYDALVGRRVLLLEGSARFRVATERTVRSLGMLVKSVGSVDEALAALAGGKFDLLLLDCDLPEGAGYALARQARAAAGNATLPILGLSARNPLEFLSRARSAGFTDAIGKIAARDSFADIFLAWFPKA